MIFSTNDTRPAIVIFVAWAVLLVAPSVLTAQQPARPDPDTREKILADQERLAEQYRLLEEKLFSLYQFEQDQNPERSELLQKAYQQSREQLTLEKFRLAVREIDQSRLRNAEKSQSEIAVELQGLLELLQSEDRSKRVREQIDRYKEYLKEINRILRIQQGIRGQGEREQAEAGLQDLQQENARRTAELNQKIQQQESSSGDASAAEDSAEPDSQGDTSQPGQDNPSPPSDDAGSQESSSTPAQNRLQQARQKMEQAAKKLQEARQQESVEVMREAERELQKAREELEKILRQLREEEIKRTLASLESRFRKMLEIQIRIQEDTATLDAGREQAPLDEVEIQSGKLAVRQQGLVTEADRAMLILEDDGSSIAVFESLRQARLDMQQIAERLAAARTGEVTREIQASVIETLGFLVEVFEKAQQDDDAGSTPPSQAGQGQPGDAALINQIAELKLIRGLQSQIMKRHVRYSERLPDPDDLAGHSDDPAIQQALEQLSERQTRLHKITHDIVVGKNR